MAKGIANLFNSIAGDYDRLNHLLSLNIDKLWRRRSLKNHLSTSMEHVLDVACGTGDFSIQLVKMGAKRVTGADVSEGMMAEGRKKVEALGLNDRIALEYGDCADMKYDDNTFDLCTCAFGVRNFAERAKGLREMNRVLKPGAEVLILEFSQPAHFPMKQLYRFYFKKILPTVGGWISGNKAAYEYLPNSVYAFPQGEEFMNELRAAGFTNVHQRRFTFGIATVYYGTK